MSGLRTLLLCIVAVMVVLLAIGLFKFQQAKNAPEAALALLPENADISINEVHQVSTRDGVKEWSLDAATVRFVKKDERSILKDVSVTFFLKSGKTVHVTGNEGFILTDTKDMEIKGDVVVRTDDYTLKTEKLSYDGKSRSVYTDKPVALEGEGVSLFGNNMFFSFVDEQVEVGGGVRTVVKEFSL